MRIAIDARALFTHSKRGIGTYTKNLFNALSNIDLKNEYLLLTTLASEFYYQDELERTVQGEILNKFNFKQEIIPEFSFEYSFSTQVWEQFLLPNRLNHLNVDIYYSPHFTAPLLFKVPKVITVHDLCFLVLPFDSRTAKYFHFWTGLSIKGVDKIIADSQSTKNDIIKYYKVEEEKITVIYGAADEIYHPITQQELLDKVKKKYNLPTNFILCLGVIEPRKNMVNLIKAYHILKTKYKIDHKLVIAGARGGIRGRPYNEVFHKTKELGLDEEVIFLGYVHKEDLPLIYNAATLFAFPSLYEGFGLPVLEAMACGTPVVTSNVSSLPEIVGEAGMLIDPYNVEELAEVMYKVLTDSSLQSQLRDKGLKQVKKFSWEKAAKETLAVYENLYSEN